MRDRLRRFNAWANALDRRTAKKPWFTALAVASAVIAVLLGVALGYWKSVLWVVVPAIGVGIVQWNRKQNRG